MTISSDKKYIRDKFRSKRLSLSPKEQVDAAMCIAKKVMNEPRIYSLNNIAIFFSFDGEINTGPLISDLLSIGKNIYLPLIHPFFSKELLFMRYTVNTPLILNRFNIYEPKLDFRKLLPISKLDILFIPLVACDFNGNRLGMGGGFYDYLLKYFWRKNFYPIGLAYDSQITAHLLPRNSWDISLPEIITPSYHLKI